MPADVRAVRLAATCISAKSGTRRKTFQSNTAVFKQNKRPNSAAIAHRIVGRRSARLPMRDMLEQKLTFSEAVAGENFSLMGRSASGHGALKLSTNVSVSA